MKSFNRQLIGVTLTSIAAVMGVLSFSPLALSDDSPELSIGGGIQSKTSTDSIQALLRVEYQTKADQRSSEVRFVTATIRTDASIDVQNLSSDDLMKNISFLDVEMSALGIHYQPNAIWVAANVLGVNVQRNLEVGNDMIARVSLAGLQSGVSFAINDSITLMLNSAIDLLGLAMVKEGDTNHQAMGYGAKLEAGVQVTERYRVTFGHKVDGARGSSDESIESNWQCYTSGGTSCKENAASQTYLNIAAQLNETFSVFGRASYSVYRVKTGDAVSTNNSAMQFRLGVGYNF